MTRDIADKIGRCNWDQQSKETLIDYLEYKWQILSELEIEIASGEHDSIIHMAAGLLAYEIKKLESYLKER